MTEAFAWLLRHQPEETGDVAVCWNDARLSNAIFDDSGQIVGALDWEQACVCPAETDFAWWLATRRQMLEVNGLDPTRNCRGSTAASRSSVASRR